MNKIEEFLKQVMVVDTETTGTDIKVAEVIEVAGGLFFDGSWITTSTLIKPKNPIPPEASAINFISNKMVADCLTFDDKIESVNKILGFSSKRKIGCMVAHNSNFDRMMLTEAYRRAQKLDLLMPFDEERKWICTWRLAKVVLGIDYNLVQYGMQYLRYRLDLDVDDELSAHRAEADVITCGKLIEKLLEIAIENEQVDPTKDILPQLVGLCWDPMPINKWTIGKKYAGCELNSIPNSYYMWALENIDELNDENPRFNRDLASAVEKILEDRGVI